MTEFIEDGYLYWTIIVCALFIIIASGISGGKNGGSDI